MGGGDGDLCALNVRHFNLDLELCLEILHSLLLRACILPQGFSLLLHALGYLLSRLVVLHELLVLQLQFRDMLSGSPQVML